MQKKYIRLLKCDFTADEITAKARELAAANRKRSDIEQRKKEIDADLKARIEEQNTLVQRLSEQITVGFEYRDIECRVDLDVPEKGQKTVIRLDTGEVVEVTRMTPDDCQMALELEEQAAKEQPVVIPEERRLDAPGTVAGPVRLTGEGDGWRAEIVILETSQGFAAEVSMELNGSGPMAVDGIPICMAESEAREAAAARLHQAAQRHYAEAHGRGKKNIRGLLLWCAQHMGKRKAAGEEA